MLWGAVFASLACGAQPPLRRTCPPNQDSGDCGNCRPGFIASVPTAPVMVLTRIRPLVGFQFWTSHSLFGEESSRSMLGAKVEPVICVGEPVLLPVNFVKLIAAPGAAGVTACALSKT